MHVKRPLGVTIIAILMIINGSFLLFSGLSSFVITSNFNSRTDLMNSTLSGIDTQSSSTAFSREDFETVMENFDYFLYFVGILLVVFSLVHYFIAYGLLRARSWARKMTIIIAVMGILINVVIILLASAVLNMVKVINDSLAIFGGNIFTIIINSLIIYYLYKKEVKNYFIYSKNKFSSDSFSSLSDLR